MKKNLNPAELSSAILGRSTCAVQVGAVLSDSHGVFSWGWNHSGKDGLGQHAEAHCLSRANPSRLSEATIYIAAQRSRHKKVITSRPCEDCQKILKKVKHVIYRDEFSNLIQWK